MRRRCANCGWLSVNPSGTMFCGYSDERTWEDESCMAWKDNEEPQTNADRIRSMTDEELATFLTNNQVEVFRKVVKEMCNLLDVPFPYKELTKEVTDKYEEMKKEQLEWLKQEVSE